MDHIPEDQLHNYPERSTRDRYDTIETDFGTIDLFYLRNYVRDLMPGPIAIEGDVIEQLKRQEWNSDPENKVHPRDILGEFQRLGNIDSVISAHPDWNDRITRILAADYSQPIIIVKGLIIDGLHRILHAAIDGQTEISAHVIENPPAELFLPGGSLL